MEKLRTIVLALVFAALWEGPAFADMYSIPSRQQGIGTVLTVLFCCACAAAGTWVLARFFSGK